MTDEQYKQLYVPLREHFDQRLKDMDRAVEESRRLMEARMDGFPSQFVRKGEIDSNLARVEEQLCSLNEFKAKAEGMASQRSLEVVRWVSIVGLIISLIGILLSHYRV